MSTVPLYIVDAFTATAFRGNPASVCVIDGEFPETIMQAVAAEMNHPETAFLRPLDAPVERATRFSLRWFTPKVEVPLCGHATLAACAVIFEELGNPAAELRFETRSGVLAAHLEGRRIALDFPCEDLVLAPVSSAVLNALSVRTVTSSRYARNDRNLLLHLASERQLRKIAPDFAALKAADAKEPVLGLIVTAAGSNGYDFVSRYFAPWLGVDEDPVTGAAHCALAPYWANLIGKAEMRAYQASERGGEMTVRLKGGRVELVGDAVVVSCGTFRFAPSRRPERKP